MECGYYQRLEDERIECLLCPHHCKIANGKTGSLVQNDKISMLYNEKGVAMASFSLTKGKGVMASYTQTGVVSNGASYFGVTTGDKNATPVISESDKAVMLANGYAGVCINGKYVNWP